MKKNFLKIAGPALVVLIILMVVIVGAMEINLEDKFIVDNSGKVGIGIPNPESELHIWGSGAQVLRIESNDNDATALELVRSSSPQRDWQIKNDGGVLKIGSGPDKNYETMLFVDSNGGVSINELEGVGNAYACLSSSGKLFRSNVPCR